VTLAVTMMRPGDRYIGGTPGTTVSAGGPTVIDVSLGKRTVQAAIGDDAVIGRPNDAITIGNGLHRRVSARASLRIS